MQAKFSAYLTIYNDWEFLEPVLRSIAPYVDALVVVDGAYKWMAPFLTAMGNDLQHSDPRMRDIVAASGIPYRIVSGVWANEIEKRLAGYRACTGDYVCRIDSDEILFFDDKELERFFRRRGAVAQVEMPTYIAPGWVKIPATHPPRGRRAKLRALFHAPRMSFKRYSFLFDRNRVSPEIHLNYLSLVLDVDKRPRVSEMPFNLYERPIGFGAHLTTWRSIPAAAYRAEAYVLHYILRNGVPWLPQLENRPVAELTTLFEIVPPQMFREIMLASRLGMKDMLGEEIVMAPSPLTADQEAIFARYYKDLLAGHAKLNQLMCEPGLHFTPDLPVVIDISQGADSIAPDGVLLVELANEVVNAGAQLRSLIPRPPWQVVSALEPRLNGQRLAVRLPPMEAGILRREIELKIRTKSAEAVQHFKIQTARPLPPGT